MSDRLALANAIEDAGIPRDKAQRVASQAGEARLNARIHLVEHRLLTRLGGLAVVLSGAIVAALHYWPPHG
jgi:hypothetical protein